MLLLEQNIRIFERFLFEFWLGLGTYFVHEAKCISWKIKKSRKVKMSSLVVSSQQKVHYVFANVMKSYRKQ